MTEAELMEFAYQAIMLTLKIAAPAMLAGLVVGLIVSLFQALTQIQEMTLSFVPKIIAIFAMILLTLPMMGSSLRTFTETIADKIVSLG